MTRSPNILDIVKAVTEVAPSYPEVSVWWYARADVPGVRQVLVVLEARDGSAPAAASIASELEERLNSVAVAVRMHRGAGETPGLYRLLTTADSRVPARPTEGW
jgi:hypothetical protein